MVPRAAGLHHHQSYESYESLHEFGWSRSLSVLGSLSMMISNGGCRSAIVAMWMSLFVLATVQLSPMLSTAGTSTDRDAIRRILLESRHLGAHGLGYNAQSHAELAKELSPAAVPTLLDLLVHDHETRVGAIFGLASQCGAAIRPIL